MKLPRRNKGEVNPPVASMGDIAFLLIIFFMVTTTFVQEANVSLTLPKAEDLEKVKTSNVSVAIDSDGLVYVNGKEVKDPEKNFKKALEDKTKGKPVPVFFKCDKDIQRRHFEDILVMITESDARIILLGEQTNPEMMRKIYDGE
jgi:biopolymer transport protein ExbD